MPLGLGLNDSGGGGQDFVYKTLIFAMVISIVFPSAFAIFGLYEDDPWSDVQDTLNEDYFNMTGMSATNRSVWALTGIYTPYDGGINYAYTADGWLYGSKIVNYSPSQYPDRINSGTGTIANPEYYSVTNNNRGIYEYVTAPSSQSNINAGDIYTQVSFDVSQKSSKLFTTSGKTESGTGFYYEYTGYRYAFQPLSDYYTSQSSTNSDGTVITSSETTKVIATTTSLSLVWYKSPINEALAGQLVLSGSDNGVNYITLNQLMARFNNTNSTSTFNMVFNGITMDLTIKINPYYLARGESIADAWELGHWSIMVSSQSMGDTGQFQSSNFDLSKLVDTIKSLLFFDMEKYGLSPWLATLCSIMYVMPLGAAYLTLLIKHPLVMGIISIGAGVVTGISSLLGL